MAKIENYLNLSNFFSVNFLLLSGKTQKSIKIFPEAP